MCYIKKACFDSAAGLAGDGIAEGAFLEARRCTVFPKWRKKWLGKHATRPATSRRHRFRFQWALPVLGRGADLLGLRSRTVQTFLHVQDVKLCMVIHVQSLFTKSSCLTTPRKCVASGAHKYGAKLAWKTCFATRPAKWALRSTCSGKLSL